jgi:hypothetical protein
MSSDNALARVMSGRLLSGFNTRLIYPGFLAEAVVRSQEVLLGHLKRFFPFREYTENVDRTIDSYGS